MILKTEKVIKEKFINAISLAYIQAPYGISVNPNNGDIYLTDAGNYVSCFDKDGNEKWKRVTFQRISLST